MVCTLVLPTSRYSSSYYLLILLTGKSSEEAQSDQNQSSKQQESSAICEIQKQVGTLIEFKKIQQLPKTLQYFDFFRETRREKKKLTHFVKLNSHGEKVLWFRDNLDQEAEEYTTSMVDELIEM